MLQRCLRDLIAGGQHFAVSDLAYETQGLFKLNMAENVPNPGTR